MKLRLVLSICIFVAGCSGSKPAPHTDMAHSYGQQAFSCFNSGNFACALVNYDKALQHAGFSDEPLLQTAYLFNIGRVYLELGRYDSAAQIFKSASDEYSFYKDSSSIRASIAFSALSFALGGHADSAELLSNLQVFEQNRLEPVFYFTIKARIAFADNEYGKTGVFLDSAALFMKKKTDPAVFALNLYYRGLVALAMKQYDKSRTLLDSSMQYMDNSAERFRRWKILTGLSVVSFCTNDTDAGTRYYYRAKECAPEGVALPSIDELKNCAYKP